MIASQPYRARVPVEFKAAKVIAPLDARAAPGRPAARHPLLRPRSGPGDRAQGVAGGEPVPDHAPRHPARGAHRARPATRATTISTPTPTAAPCSATTCTRCPPRSPTRIGTSTLFAAWNAAVYVAQIDDERLAEVVGERALSRRHARGAAGARPAVVPRRVLRHLAQARLKRWQPCPPTARRTLPSQPPRRLGAPTSPRVAAELVACGSLEMGADTPEDARRIAELLPAGTPVYVNHLPALPLGARAAGAGRAARGGPRAGAARGRAARRPRARRRRRSSPRPCAAPASPRCC